VLKLPAADRATLQAEGHAKPFEPRPGRSMGDFVALPGDPLPEAALMTAWMARALAYVAALPPKPDKPAKSTRRRSV
jgi:hypothetical protein